MDKILSLFQQDIGELLPDMDSFLSGFAGFVRLALLAGPVILLVLGLWYTFLPPKEANHRAGFRTYITMGSIQVWRFAQKLAGIIYMVLGGILTVVMFIVSLFFSNENPVAMITTALICVIIQLILVVLVWLLINALVFRVYDAKGNRRHPKK